MRSSNGNAILLSPKVLEHTQPLRAHVWKHYGKSGFKDNGQIKKNVLEKLAESAEKKVTRARAQRALNLYGKWNKH